MIDQMANLNLSFLIELTKDGNNSTTQFDNLIQFLIQEKCTFKDKPMPTLLKPNFISPRQSRRLQYTVEKISSALNKLIALYLENEEVRQIMKFSEIENDLFFINPGYNTPLVIARLDAFMNDYEVKFLEFNCDSPAGTSYSDILENGFKALLNKYEFLSQWRIDYTNRQERFWEALKTCYREFRENHPSFPITPTIAIVDWDDVSTASEFELLKNFFEAKGYHTIICSPQSFKIDGATLVVNDEPVHLIYRRVITRELIQKIDEVQDFVQGIKQGLACACNPFRSYIVGNKKILAILTDPRFQTIYDRDELDVIQRSIPWTKVLANAKAKYQGFTVDLPAFVSDNKEKLVLKPASSYGGKDVFLGRETDQATWDKIIQENIENEEWVVQEYVSIPEEIFPEIGSTVSLRLKKVNINPFAFLGKYGGTISRVSDKSIINVSAGGGLVPTMCVVRKRDLD